MHSGYIAFTKSHLSYDRVESNINVLHCVIIEILDREIENITKSIITKLRSYCIDQLYKLIVHVPQTQPPADLAF